MWAFICTKISFNFKYKVESKTRRRQEKKNDVHVKEAQEIVWLEFGLIYNEEAHENDSLGLGLRFNSIDSTYNAEHVNGVGRGKK